MSTAYTALDSKENQLAIFGGLPAITMPLPPMYPGAMRIGQEEEEAVLKVLRSKRLFRHYGPEPGNSQVKALEEEFADYIGTTRCVAVTSGTAALIAALKGWAIGPGDEVIVPAYTWVSTASAVLEVGAVPVITEVDDSLTLDPTEVEKKLTPQTKAIIAVHMRGAPCHLTELKRIANSYNVKLLEDVAQAAGGSYLGKRLGSIGDAGAFSLQINKIITCGEGGLLTSSDQNFYERVSIYHDVGSLERKVVSNDYILPGINLRMSELQGAVALVQLRRLEGLLSAAQHRKKIIKAGVSDIANKKGVTFRTINDKYGDTSIAFIFYLPDAKKALFSMEALRSEGVPARLLYHPQRPSDYHVYCNWLPILQKSTWSAYGGLWQWHQERVHYTHEMCPQSLNLLGRAVHLDISPDLTDQNVEEVVNALHKVFIAL